MAMLATEERPNTLQAHDQAPVVEARSVAKRYGSTIALRDVSLTVKSGESHALVGRNGAGKSTLVGILTGLRAVSEGSIMFSGRPAPPPADRDAWRARVACVYQHSTIIPALSVAENLFINRQPQRGGVIDWRTLRRQARDLLDRWGVDVSQDTPAGALDVESRQLVEIARALSYGARFIILDEPTAQLDGKAIRRLFRRMRELQDGGVTFLFISHHLQEVYEICQTVTVLRDARHILTGPVAEVPKDRLIEAMTGESAALRSRRAKAEATAEAGPVALDIRGLKAESVVDVSLTVRRGEVVGLTGATSSGCVEVAEVVAGLRKAESGSVTVNGQTAPTGDVAAALRLGVGCVPKSRHREGLVLTRSVGANATMSIEGKLGRLGYVPPGKAFALASRAIRRFGIVTAGPDQSVSSLSGGNQQKVVMARAMASDPSVLVLIDPTAGVDVKSKEALLGVVDQMRTDGRAVLLVSAELDDLRVCDRVLVLFHGRIEAEFAAGWSDQDLIASIEGLSSDVE